MLNYSHQEFKGNTQRMIKFEAHIDMTIYYNIFHNINSMSLQ